MTGRPVRVALADDDTLVRAGIAAILGHDPGIEVLVQAEDGGDLVRQLLASDVDIALVDVQMPRVDGLDTLVELSRARIQVPVAMLTTFSSHSYVETAIVRGARGFLLKTETPDDLIRHVHALAGGGVVLSPRVASWLVRDGAVQHLRDRAAAQARLATLTQRQREVLSLLTSGAGNAAIAEALHLSEGTVKQYVRAIFDELGVHNRVQAALVGFQASR